MAELICNVKFEIDEKKLNQIIKDTECRVKAGQLSIDRGLFLISENIEEFVTFTIEKK